MRTKSKTMLSALAMGCFILFTGMLSIQSSAMTPPSSDELIEGVKNYRIPQFQQSYGVDNISILDNVDAVFVFNEKRISEIDSEEEIKKLIEDSNEDRLDQYVGSWITTEWKADDTYIERLLGYNDKKELFELMEYNIDSNDDLTTMRMSFLLGQQYDSSMKDILLFAVDRNTPFGDYLLAKKFDDGSIKIGVLSEVSMNGLTINKGWYSFDDIKRFIKDSRVSVATNSDGTAKVGGGSDIAKKGFNYSGSIVATTLLLLGGGLVWKKKSKS